MTRSKNAAYLPIAIVFGAVGIVFLATGNSIWVAFLPLAITFFVLSQSKDGDDDDEQGGEEGSPPVVDGPQPPAI